jgi:hypothetical protein
MKDINIEAAWRAELYQPDPVYLDADSVAVFNHCLPLDAQVALLRQSWPWHLRRQLTVFAFTRAVALQRIAVARALAPQLAAVLPELAEPLGALQQADNDEQRLFLMALVALKLPGGSIVLRPGFGYRIGPTYIGELGPRWWDEDDSKALAVDDAEARAQRAATCSAPFLTPAGLSAANAEARELGRVGRAAHYLGAIVLRYAARHPDEPRLPEALHLTVRATRYGAPDRTVSLDAYNRLHNRYANSPWTRKTPFWYGE